MNEQRLALWILAAGLVFISVVFMSAVSSARDYCPVDDLTLYYTTNGRAPCAREVTEAVPLCPHPQGYGIKGMVDSSVAYLKDSTGKILTW